MATILKKKVIAADVYQMAIERINLLYDRYDTITLSFSGGKDSTVCLNLALEVARERNRLPLEVYFFDEEALHPETVEYVQRVAAMPEVRFRWYCLPVKHRNACSRKQPYWYCWLPADRAKWVRKMPAGAITELTGFKLGMTMPDCVPLLYGNEYGTVADIRGIRASESIRRLQSVSRKSVDNWITKTVGNTTSTSPIYDWTTDDVWLAPRFFGWDYNRTYDVFDKAGTSKSQQRVCPPYGEEPLGGLHQYAECWPDLWHKMIGRVAGATTAARYARTELYGYGKVSPPNGKTWRTWFDDLVELWPIEYRQIIQQNAAVIIKMHNKKTRNRPVPMDHADPISGLSWKFLCMVANRGDLKGRKRGMMNDRALKECARRGITFEQAMAEIEQ